MTVNLKKEFASLLSAMIMEILSDDEDDVVPYLAVQEILAQKPPCKRKFKDKAHLNSPSKNRAHKEVRYLQKTRFEKFVEPVVNSMLTCDMCPHTLKRKKSNCFCKDHIDPSKIREVSLVVIQKGGGPGLTDIDFRSFWRISRSTVEIIYSLINPPGTDASVTPMELLTVLWHIVTNEPIEQLESRFSTPKAKILQLESVVFERLCCLRPCLEWWPAGDAVHAVENGFKRLGGLAAIGAIRNVHFPCEKAPFNPKNFANSSGKPSVVFHLVADHRGSFTRNSYFFWPGKNNPLPDSTTLKTVPIPSSSFLVGSFESVTSKKIIIPYFGGRLSQQQKAFNQKHRNCLKALEDAVMLLVSRFKALTSLRMAHSDYVRQLVASCVLIHNLCIDLNDCIAVDESLELETFFPSVPAPTREVEYSLSMKRNELCEELALVTK